MLSRTTQAMLSYQKPYTFLFMTLHSLKTGMAGTSCITREKVSNQPFVAVRDFSGTF